MSNAGGNSADAEDHPRAAGETLVRMANDIGAFFRAEPNREDAIAGIAGHISRFWTKRMREKLNAYVKDHAAALDELPREAVARLSAG
jgi:formate dehydrogenase subunit delta